MIECEIKLKPLEVDGGYYKKCLDEHPEEKRRLFGELIGLKDDIVRNGSLPKSYRENTLAYIDRNIVRLNGGIQINNNQLSSTYLKPANLNYLNKDFLVPLLIGVGVGILIVYGGNKLWQIAEERMADGIARGMYKQLSEMRGPVG